MFCKRGEPPFSRGHQLIDQSLIGQFFQAASRNQQFHPQQQGFVGAKLRINAGHQRVSLFDRVKPADRVTVHQTAQIALDQVWRGLWQCLAIPSSPLRGKLFIRDAGGANLFNFDLRRFEADRNGLQRCGLGESRCSKHNGKAQRQEWA